MIGGQMPLIDVAAYLHGEPGALDQTARALRYACEHVGFYFLAGHGIPDTMIADTFAAAKQFHDQELDTKMVLKANAENVGYMPMKGSITKSSAVNVNTKPNLNEAYFLKRETPEEAARVGRPAGHRNQWPEDLPGFRDKALAYLSAMEALGRSLVPIYERALSLPDGYLAAPFVQPGMTLRMSHYPAVEALEDNEFSLAPHTDNSFTTFLAPNPVGGLSIRLKDGTWFDVPYVAGAFVVNTGDALARWSNEVFVSTPHRVLQPVGGDRYAIPFFMNAHADTLITCLPTCTGPDNPPRYSPQTVAEYTAWFQKSNYLHLQKADQAA
jgi:isopenicillin N synthase-like dioxygenase